MARLESFGVEHVPELHEDEYREEYRQPPLGEPLGRELPPEQHGEQHGGHREAAREDRAPHVGRDDEGVALPRPLLHHLGLGGQRGHGHGGESVHDDVDPEYLHHRERHLGADERPHEADEDRR